MVLLIVRKSHINHLVSCRVLHLPAVGFGSRAVLGIVLRKGQCLAAFDLKIQDEEIGIPSGVPSMCLQPCDNRLLLVRSTQAPSALRGSLAVCKIDIAAY